MWIDQVGNVAIDASVFLAVRGTGAFAFWEEVRMNIGEPVRELEVEPLLEPAVMPAAPVEPSVAPQPDREPVEVPE